MPIPQQLTSPSPASNPLSQPLPVMSGRSDYEAPSIPDSYSLLSGVNVLIEGPTGTGKTHSIGTLVDTGVEVFFLALESGIESLVGYYTDRGLAVPDNLHWHVLKLGTGSGGAFAQQLDAAQRIGAQTQESLYKMQDFNRATNNPFLQVLQLLANFTDQRGGKSYGDVSTWGPNRAVVMDGLTGLGSFAMAMVIGTKPLRSQTDWGLAQGVVEKCLRSLCDQCKCHFVLIGHVERETDLVFGGVKITVQTLGKALPPLIPPMFSDVILAVREGTKWSWSTAHAMADLKTRNLTVADGIQPDFKLIINKWMSRGGKLSSQVKS